MVEYKDQIVLAGATTPTLKSQSITNILLLLTDHPLWAKYVLSAKG